MYILDVTFELLFSLDEKLGEFYENIHEMLHNHVSIDHEELPEEAENTVVALGEF